jgi:hypothetical protein
MAPVYPPIEELTDKLAVYVDVDMTSSSEDAGYVTDCAIESKDWLDGRIAKAKAENVPVSAYVRAFLEVGAQLFRRRRSWSNIDPLEAPAVPPVRSDPYSAATPILDPYIGPVMA